MIARSGEPLVGWFRCRRNASRASRPIRRQDLDRSRFKPMSEEDRLSLHLSGMLSGLWTSCFYSESAGINFSVLRCAPARGIA
jgi:hypothetical protein